MKMDNLDLLKHQKQKELDSQNAVLEANPTASELLQNDIAQKLDFMSNQEPVYAQPKAEEAELEVENKEPAKLETPVKTDPVLVPEAKEENFKNKEEVVNENVSQKAEETKQPIQEEEKVTDPVPDPAPDVVADEVKQPEDVKLAKLDEDKQPQAEAVAEPEEKQEVKETIEEKVEPKGKSKNNLFTLEETEAKEQQDEVKVKEQQDEVKE